MQVPFLGVDFVTVLRATTMLIFIAIFAGIVIWLLSARGREQARAQGLDILRDDTTRPEGRPDGRPDGRPEDRP